MSFDALVPALVVSSSLVSGAAIFFLEEERHRARTALNLAGATATLALVGVMVWGVFHEHDYESRLGLLPNLDLVLRADALSVFFVLLSAGLWFLTTIYAIGYLEDSPHRSRFFGFFSVCVSATMGVALAGNLITFFIFYELLTLSTYPLVVHRGTEESLRAGRMYLAYTLGGGVSLLLGTAWLTALAGPLEFRATGMLAAVPGLSRAQLTAIFVLLVAGLGVKAALVPLHAWLPRAMVAPAPVTALLHAVAVVKAGAFGIVRVVYDLYGVELAADLDLLLPLALVAALTIVYGSILALRQDGLKRRLAYSTVSQVSYITLGAATFGPIATTGGIVHLVHQGIMKITLFFCAGALAETLGIHRVSEMRGVGGRMPWTMAAFTIASLGMIGVPPLAGFVSKWYLAAGAIDAGQMWVLLVLAASTLLNAAYFLPIAHAAWFAEPRGDFAPARPPGPLEGRLLLLGPLLVTAALVIAAGALAAAGVSPLQWAELITAREYGG